MDPLTYYRFGLARHEEMIREAEKYRAAKAVPAEPTGWQHLIARVRQAGRRTGQPDACPDMLTSTQ